MKTTILVAGATGNLGGRIVKALLEQGANVRALVRHNSDESKVEHLKQSRVDVVTADMNNLEELTKACEGVACVVSVLQGLHDVIVDTQTLLLNAAVAAGVPRFIPSDFSTDFTQIAPGENRNFDLRREFKERLDQALIAATSIMNGAFAEILAYGTPLLNLKDKTAGYWENPDLKMDFTTMDDTAAFTAAAALDASTPRILHIASFQLSANGIAETATEVLQQPFKLAPMGTLADLSAHNQRERAAHPEGEQEVFPRWQQSQYIQSMFSVQIDTLDNDRYPDLTWTSALEMIKQLGQRGR
ncbi:NmrA family NAD(P)-binding protein [Mucilaginibacter galii]|nr:NmrA family NAD(P)-binding protein [Mucilaginibacter galii]